MKRLLRFLIIDGYPKSDRDGLKAAGMSLASDLYAKMLLRYLPEARYDILFPSDEGGAMPDTTELEHYSGILWTGCSLCVLDTHLPTVTNQIRLSEQAFELGIPSFGSCWGLQIATVAAGGEVEINPKGREMGIARKISLTKEGEVHPMFEGKPKVFEAFISHDDHVTGVPEQGVVLAGNDFTTVQALEVVHNKGTFWSTQYHPEYDLNEIACLMMAREEKLIKIGFFTNRKDLLSLVDRMKLLFKEPDRKDLRWQLVIDDDVLSEKIRQVEFKNYINKLVLPHAGINK